ncbi:MAG TPA: HD domain-containing phosphohydrolase [Thermoanaerobaculia bacterium]|jgi:HD-GYP domain-containing protein (c-di-GMP phosphodiesterase class II)
MAEPRAAAFRRVLLHGALRPELATWLAADEIRAEKFREDSWSLAADEVGLVLGGLELTSALALPPPPGLGEAADRVGLLQLGDSLVGLDPFWEARLVFSLPEDALQPHRARALLASFRILEERARGARDRRSLLARTNEAQALVEVGIALSAETDPQRLLETILTRARRLTAADAGSLYLVTPPDSPDSLKFVLAQNDSVRFEFREAVLPLEHPSIAGFVARTGEVVQVGDAREIPAGAPYRFDAEFDERIGYRTRSILAVPLATPDGRTIGVLQLINRKRLVMPNAVTTGFIKAEVVPFEESHRAIARSLAAQAAVAVENRRLTESIRTLFEGFVEAAVTAIEQRDPTTSGHSHRVAAFTCALAEAVDRAETGPYAAFRVSRDELRELRYAAVLHDFGKVGVREQVLVKARKLSPGGRELIRARFEQALLAAGAEEWEAAARNGGGVGAVTEALSRRREELEASWKLVERADEPRVEVEADAAGAAAGTDLDALRTLAFRARDGNRTRLLTDGELACLSIAQGSLTPEERLEIESHVTQTFRFLTKIPWTRDLARVPDWAYAHHEKLDGSGYPRRLRADDIPVPVRMLTICDIFDALAARDRPYKRAVPGEDALRILSDLARKGAVDSGLLDIFVGSEVWKQAIPNPKSQIPNPKSKI